MTFTYLAALMTVVLCSFAVGFVMGVWHGKLRMRAMIVAEMQRWGL